MTTATILLGDVRDRLREIPDKTIHTCITSPPYYGLRDYGEDTQIGLEHTLERYVETLTDVFREVRRVLRDDGTLWLNLGETYLPSKQLGGVPWRVAFALQADGWYLRQDVIWAKPNPMPESVNDRCTKAHEYVFLLTKSPRYYFDNIAIKEPTSQKTNGPRSERKTQPVTRNKRSVWSVPVTPFRGAHFAVMPEALVEPCVAASVSMHTCATCCAPYRRLITRAPIAERRLRENRIGVIPGRDKPSRMQSVDMEVREATTVGWSPTCECEPDNTGISTVLDPFTGSGTVAVVAMRHHANFIGIELNPDYASLARRRIEEDQPLMNTATIR
jgi:DNA modification methylase